MLGINPQQIIRTQPRGGSRTSSRITSSSSSSTTRIFPGAIRRRRRRAAPPATVAVAVRAEGGRVRAEPQTGSPAIFGPLAASTCRQLSRPTTNSMPGRMRQIADEIGAGTAAPDLAGLDAVLKSNAGEGRIAADVPRRLEPEPPTSPSSCRPTKSVGAQGSARRSPDARPADRLADRARVPRLSRMVFPHGRAGRLRGAGTAIEATTPMRVSASAISTSALRVSAWATVNPPDGLVGLEGALGGADRDAAGPRSGEQFHRPRRPSSTRRQKCRLAGRRRRRPDHRTAALRPLARADRPPRSGARPDELVPSVATPTRVIAPPPAWARVVVQKNQEAYMRRRGGRSATCSRANETINRTQSACW